MSLAIKVDLRLKRWPDDNENLEGGVHLLKAGYSAANDTWAGGAQLPHGKHWVCQGREVIGRKEPVGYRDVGHGQIWV